jgi:hypothetical protein
MAKFLQLALWNTNGLTQHTEELKTFISIHNNDVMLTSKKHFTEKGYLKLPNYTVYHTNHPFSISYPATEHYYPKQSDFQWHTILTQFHKYIHFVI